jgi:hypothetical protein
MPASINICWKAGSAITVRVACAICTMIQAGSRPVRPTRVQVCRPHAHGGAAYQEFRVLGTVRNAFVFRARF